MTISTAQLFSIIDTLVGSRSLQMCRVTMGGGVSHVAGFGLRDVRDRVFEISPQAIILGIDA